LAIGPDNKVVIAYADGSNNQLGYAHCGDASCSAQSITAVDNVTVSGISLTIGSDQRPIISYFDSDNNQLKFVHCDSPDCTDPVSVVVDDSSASVGQHSEVTIGTDGLPIISYTDWDNHTLRLAHCASRSCTPFWRR